MPTPNLSEDEEFEFRARAEQERNYTPTGFTQSGVSAKGPFQLPQFKMRFGNDVNLPTEGQPYGVDFSDTEKKMAQEGIDITSGTPYNLRNRIDLVPGATDEDKKNIINQYYGRDVGVSKDAYGHLEYLNPQTGRRTLVNSVVPQLPTAGGAADFLGQSVGGGLGGAAAIPTGNPLAVGAASTLGAAGGQGVVDLGKYIVSRSMGLAPNRPVTEVASQAGKDMASAGASTAAGEIVMGLPRMARFALTGPLSLKYKNAVEMQGWLDKSQNDLDDYYSLVGGNEKFRLSVPELLQTSDNQQVQKQAFEQQENFVNSYRSLPDIRAQERVRLQSNLTQLQSDFQSVTDNYKPPNYQPGQSGEDIKNHFLAVKQAQYNQAQLQQEIAQENAKRAAQGLPSWSRDQMDQMLTGMLNQVESSGKDRMDSAYTNLNIMLGVPKEVAGLKSTDSLFQAQAPKIQIPLSPVTQAKLKVFYQNALAARNSEDTSIGDSMLSALPNNFFADRTNPLGGLNLDGQYDLYWTIQNIQSMRATGRQLMRSSNGNIQPRDQDILKMTDLLAENIQDYFQRKGDPAIMGAWEQAQQETRNYAQNFRNNILSQVMEKRNGFPATTYNQATSKLLMNNGKGQPQQGVQELSDILQGDPEARNDVRNMVWSLYKDQGYMPPDGIPTRASWQKFQNDYEGPIKAFFDKDDVAQMKSYEQMSDEVVQANNNIKNFNKAWRASDYGQLSSPNSNALTNAVFSKSVTPDKFKGLANYLYREQPDLGKALAGDTAARFAKMVSDPNGIPIPGKINAMLQEYGPRLQEVIGPDYVATVRAIAAAGEKQSTLNTLSGYTAMTGQEPESIYKNVIRWLVAPPMSGEGRGVTALWAARRRAAGRVVYNALSSPEGLRDFMMKRDLSNTSQVAQGVLGDLAGRSLTVGED